jgi:starvation-inducible DNA-binding protein
MTFLANYQVFYQNVSGFHWNIKGNKFFELHVKFEELYTDLHTKSMKLQSVFSLWEVLPCIHLRIIPKFQKLKAIKNASEDVECVKGVLDAFAVLLEKQRVILELSAKMDDEGTNALASDYIREQEKLVWMYSSWLGK